MKTSVDELAESLEQLYRLAYHPDGKGGYLRACAHMAERVGDRLSDNNKALGDAWQTVSTTIRTISNELENKLGLILSDIGAFVEETRSNETAALSAVNAINEKSEEILNRLKLNNS